MGGRGLGLIASLPRRYIFPNPETYHWHNDTMSPLNYRLDKNHGRFLVYADNLIGWDKSSKVYLRAFDVADFLDFSVTERLKEFSNGPASDKG